MYKGKVNVPQKHLTSFMSSAEALKIRGMYSRAESLGEELTNFDILFRSD